MSDAGMRRIRTFYRKLFVASKSVRLSEGQQAEDEAKGRRNRASEVRQTKNNAIDGKKDRETEPLKCGRQRYKVTG